MIACFNNSPYKGYTETDTGLHYKLRVIGDGSRKPSIGDFLQLNISYLTLKDSVFLDSYSSNATGMVILPFNHSSFRGSFEEGLRIMNEGDSVSFIVSADSLFNRFFKSGLPYFLLPGSRVKMEVKLNKIFNSNEYQSELSHYDDLVEDRDIEEQRRLHLFMDTSQVHYSAMNNGMFYLPVKQGTGDLAERGNLVKIHYKGYFLNGRPFESTYDRGQAMEYTVGEQGQVIRGLESAISLMNEGSKAKFIIPSQLAYGGAGSSTGIIPPFTTVIYEIELLNLTKYNN
ncbi:MAG: FKBP-type peptidyl-prolyl cis-trans isomerase [Bacteroidota bacterium]|nr:FKBP-type peptidyl-prolyl cis-trans isomerase [Bacteroidota bacterium]